MSDAPICESCDAEIGADGLCNCPVKCSECGEEYWPGTPCACPWRRLDCLIEDQAHEDEAAYFAELQRDARLLRLLVDHIEELAPWQALECYHGIQRTGAPCEFSVQQFNPHRRGDGSSMRDALNRFFRRTPTGAAK